MVFKILLILLSKPCVTFFLFIFYTFEIYFCKLVLVYQVLNMKDLLIEQTVHEEALPKHKLLINSDISV